MTEPTDPAFEALLEYVRDERGFDFTGYKRPTLLRRFQKRLDAVGASSYDAYRERLESEPDEFAQLFDTILINVTRFFRDQPAWDYLERQVIPQILEDKARGQPIRVWSAGCATGEEACSVAMLFVEALGDEHFRQRVKIYATDVDGDALSTARHAVYAPKQLADLDPARRERYFQASNHHHAFRSDLRRAIIFGRNDLLQDPPISRVDLLIARNTLMYFGAEAQERVLSNFFFALQPRGYLMLGKAEALQSRTSLFSPLDLKRRIFVKNHGLDGGLREGGFRFTRMPTLDPDPAVAAEPELRDTAFEHAPLAQLVVQSAGQLSAANHAARVLLGVSTADVGKPLRDLQVSYRPVDLRSLIDQVHTEHRPATSKDVSWIASDGNQRNLDVYVAPLYSQTGSLDGVVISFVDSTRSRTLHDELERVRRDLETAYEELQSTVEELETTNEELQSTNEELETTNEELQSTNEELETMNEELQSTNEELETMNDEMRDRTDDALRANAFFSSILSSFQQCVVVVDREFAVAAWSRAAEDAWGLREEEARGQNLLSLDIGIQAGELRDSIRATLAGEEPTDVVLTGHDRRGKPIVCTVSFAQLHGAHGEVQGAILLMTVEPT